MTDKPVDTSDAALSDCVALLTNPNVNPYIRRVAADAIEALQAERVELVAALWELQLAEATYRKLHDLHGRGSMKVGRAWDELRRAGDKARALLSRYPTEDDKG